MSRNHIVNKVNHLSQAIIDLVNQLVDHRAWFTGFTLWAGTKRFPKRGVIHA